MTKQELRVGNIVTDEFYESFKKIITVESINDKGINLEVQNSDDYPEMQSHWIEPYYTFDQLQGIELSEEWLIKMGFGKCDEHESGHNEHSVFGFYYDWHFKRFYLECETDRVRVPHIQYVHQLQNLFYALTGTELTID
jgi:hypothetical protein